jgi:transcriptional regulator with XRE-family HTH domain
MSSMKTHGEILAGELQDEEFRREWERLEFARAVAAMVVAYRADHGLTQRQLAERLGLTQPAVARIESGEHNPKTETLMLLAGRLGLDLTIRISPESHEEDPPLERVDATVYAHSEVVNEATHSSLSFLASAA